MGNYLLDLGLTFGSVLGDCTEPGGVQITHEAPALCKDVSKMVARNGACRRKGIFPSAVFA